MGGSPWGFSLLLLFTLQHAVAVVLPAVSTLGSPPPWALTGGSLWVLVRKKEHVGHSILLLSVLPQAWAYI